MLTKAFFFLNWEVVPPKKGLLAKVMGSNADKEKQWRHVTNKMKGHFLCLLYHIY